MEWVFLSPHFDDAVLSCGGLIWEQARSGDSVQIWTICAGEIPAGELSPFAKELHQRWNTGREAVAHRKIEDFNACNRIGAVYRHFPVPDCVYRRVGDDYLEIQGKHAILGGGAGDFLYPGREDIFGPIQPAENGLIQQLGRKISLELPKQAELVSPLAIGGHIDHKLVRAVAEFTKRPLWYYADFPYVLEDAEMIDRRCCQGWKDRLFEITAEGLQAWFESIKAYGSQISTFWPDFTALHTALLGYVEKMEGVRLWRPPQEAQK